MNGTNFTITNKTPLSLAITGSKMEPAVRVELTTNGLQIRCSATELRRHMFSRDWKNEARIMRIFPRESNPETGNSYKITGP